MANVTNVTNIVWIANAREYPTLTLLCLTPRMNVLENYNFALSKGGNTCKAIAGRMNLFALCFWDVMKSRGLDPTKAFPMSMINRLQDIGRAQQLLKSILDSEIFENLSKHSMFWHSDRCVDAEKLDDIRGRVVCLNDNLWDLWRILRMEEEE